MSTLPYIMQLGMGVDLHGSNDTKAARKAVKNAIQNNNMLFLRHARLKSMEHLLVDVEIASPNPDTIDIDAVAAEFPVGKVTVTTQQGGMISESGADNDPVLVAIASVTVSVST